MRDPEIYYFSVFGEPTPKGPWGWRVEGHHVSIHFTVVGGTSVASSPTFLGTNPAEVREGPKKGLRILGAEEDAARALLDSLDASQRTTAMITDIAPTDIVTTNGMKADPLSPVGVKASALSPKQRDLLIKVVDVYVSLMTDDVAAARMAKLKKAGLENIAFAWAGPTTRGAKHYYRVQGPTFLIEYRQYPERRQPRTFGVARFRRRLRARPAAGAHQERRALNGARDAGLGTRVRLKPDTTGGSAEAGRYRKVRQEPEPQTLAVLGCRRNGNRRAISSACGRGERAQRVEPQRAGVGPRER